MCVMTVKQISSLSAEPASRWQGEPTLEELLSDPITVALMDADLVNRNKLTTLLQAVKFARSSSTDAAATMRQPQLIQMI